MEELDGLIVTRENAEQRLFEIEQQLATRLSITGDVRAALMELDRAGKLIEDELVADWHDAYASVVNFEDCDQVPNTQN